jgi:hypothetical protein
MRMGRRVWSGCLAAVVAAGVAAGCNSESSENDGDGGSAGIDLDACVECGDEQCPNEASACDSAQGCRGLLDCVFDCDSSDVDCRLDCAQGASAGAQSAALAFYTCSINPLNDCLSTCVPATGTGGSGGGGNGGTGATGAGGTGTGGGVSGTGGSGGGSGGSPPAMRCGGTVTPSTCAPCGGSAPSCTCSSVLGCVLGAPMFTCAGTPTLTCDYYNGAPFTECVSAGCDVDDAGNCVGPTSCAGITDFLKCDQRGCTANVTAIPCTGTPTPCAQLPAATCPAQPGCMLVPQ